MNEILVDKALKINRTSKDNTNSRMLKYSALPNENTFNDRMTGL
jgi:hypothetical protein